MAPSHPGCPAAPVATGRLLSLTTPLRRARAAADKMGGDSASVQEHVFIGRFGTLVAASPHLLHPQGDGLPHSRVLKRQISVYSLGHEPCSAERGTSFLPSLGGHRIPPKGRS